jgi:ATP-dependent exoDNAse (exonuclease V) beta subunit
MKVEENTVSPFDISDLHFNSNSGLIRIKGSHKLKLAEEAEAALEKGIKMHFILSEINSVNEIDSVLEKMMKQGIISETEKPELQQKIKDILKNGLIEKYFTGSLPSKNEAEMITENGELLRPDKIVFEDAGIVLIDYKTGKPNTKKYALQMNKYAEALQNMRHTSVRKVLVYLDENLVEEIK